MLNSMPMPLCVCAQQRLVIMSTGLPSYRQNATSCRVCCLKNVFHCPPSIQQVQSNGAIQVRGREQDQNLVFFILSIERDEAHAGNVYGDLRKEGWLI